MNQARLRKQIYAVRTMDKDMQVAASSRTRQRRAAQIHAPSQLPAQELPQPLKIIAGVLGVLARALLVAVRTMAQLHRSFAPVTQNTCRILTKIDGHTTTQSSNSSKWWKQDGCGHNKNSCRQKEQLCSQWYQMALRNVSLALRKLPPRRRPLSMPPTASSIAAHSATHGPRCRM